MLKGTFERQKYGNHHCCFFFFHFLKEVQTPEFLSLFHMWRRQILVKTRFAMKPQFLICIFAMGHASLSSEVRISMTAQESVHLKTRRAVAAIIFYADKYPLIWTAYVKSQTPDSALALYENCNSSHLFGKPTPPLSCTSLLVSKAVYHSDWPIGRCRSDLYKNRKCKREKKKKTA